ncbi:MAG: PEGA domain-containing protein [Labilithrix sp.]|nr:PEGA domain-containing protein [Labilithrix sp.]
MQALRKILLLLLAAVLSCASAPRSAFAQAPAAQDADDAKRKGDEAMVAIRYEEALGHYRRAYEQTKNPALLYNMGRAYEGLADFPKALDALEEFAEKASPELKARVPKLEELLTDVRNRVATMILSSPVGGAEIRLGNKVIATTKAGQNIVRVNAGPQPLTVWHKDYFPFERQLTLAPGKIETVDVVLASRTEEALLRVTSPVTGAAVTIDGKAIGVVPAESPMKPGQHRIALARDGYDPAETSVVLAAGEKKEVSVPMAVHETITGKWWFWTGIGVLVVGGIVGTVVALTTEKDPDVGTIPPGTVKAESFGFRF